jgi:hypothetical protein
MADTSPNSTPSGSIGSSSFREPALRLKLGLAEMLKGGVIMDVMNVEQARIAEEAGAISVMALERVPAMIRAEGGVARMANPKLIREIMAAVTIPVMAKARIGHFAEAQVLQKSTSPKSSPPPTRPTTSTSTPSPRPSSAARAIWAKPSAASPRAQP